MGARFSASIAAPRGQSSKAGFRKSLAKGFFLNDFRKESQKSFLLRIGQSH
jgi:hypothetical protein